FRSLEYGDFGFTPGSGTLLNNLDTQEYLITGLSEGEYEFYIQAVCSPTESSLWIGPFSFNLTQGSDCMTAFNYGLINDAASFNTIESSGYHWYTVTLNQDYDEVLFSTCNSDFDTKINVYSDCSNQIGYNDDDDYSLCTNDLNSTVYYESLPAGIYYVMVYGYDSNEFGDYTLEISSDNSIPRITASGSNFYESNDNDGAIANAIILTLENDQFTNVGNLMTEGMDYNLTYVPAGMTFQVLVLSESQVMLSYSGYADSHNATDNASFDFNFLDNAYVGNNGNAVINNYLYFNVIYTDVMLSSDLALTEPSSGYNCDLNETTQVPYMVENTGTATITAGTSFTLYLESESVVLLNEDLVVEEDMAPGSSQFGLTTNTVDLSAVGAVVYKAYIDYEHDANLDNDTINGFIVHFDQVISFPADDDMNDTIITGSFPFVVSAEVTYTPDSAYLSPEWQWLAGSTTNELSVNEEGWYTLILNTDGCYTEDSVYIKLFVGRTSVFDETSISIYPNPNQGRFIVEISSAEIENAKIEILSIDGKLIHSEEINCNTTLSKEFDISSYSSGLYFVKISSGNKSYNQRIVKQ
ncbi:MAG: T9SS type A sorting domain-containing protein, partial [Ignavibacteriaceae bacterium]|nr:T9SS type A sorting domain-containing protein [Ignavibacteriaceae bacterium]